MQTEIKKTKILRSHTIVPSELYVKRAADSQLADIIIDKGRPGYVLVSRQMGKTNLLLNAKREFQNSLNFFLYLDISNNFPNLSSFFRNIINTAIETSPEKFILSSKKVHDLRHKEELKNFPHKEHEQELRFLLQDIKGDLTICLDEVDSIIKTNYSDEVFSFIRSVYFSGRVNFPEFNRLNYILSGVAEPSELIKDRSSSPFNIGEKIYLDDFSLDELEQFYIKSKIKIDSIAKDRIYYWAGGNPRVTWDICSGVESLILEGKTISPKSIDDFVESTYFKSFDIPPIDHIRDLAEDDADVRTSLIAIHYQKSDSLSTQQISKLYLAGIVNSSKKGDKVFIKNRIISESLSESWLKEIDESKSSIIERANKWYESKNYAEALPLYQEYIKSISSDNLIDQIVYHKMGSSSYELGEYRNAVLYLTKNPYPRTQSIELHLSQKYWLALCHFFLDELVQSEAYFREVISDGITVNFLHYYYDACVNLTSVLISDIEKNSEEIIKLANIAINAENNQSVKNTAQTDILLSVANINLSTVYSALSNKPLAILHLNNAIKLSDKTSKVGLLNYQLTSGLSDKSAELLLQETMDYIYDNSIPVSLPDPRYPNKFTLNVAISLVEALANDRDPQNLSKFVNFLLDADLSHAENAFSILTMAAFTCITEGRYPIALIISDKALELPIDIQDSSSKRLLLVYAILIEDNAEFFTIREEQYVSNYWSCDSQIEDVDLEADYRILDILVNKHIKIGQLDKANDLINDFKRIKQNFLNIDDKSNIPKLILVDYLDFLNAVASRKEDSLTKAIAILELMQRDYLDELMYVNKTYFNNIKTHIINFIKTKSPIKTFKREYTKYGRNQIVQVRFSDGRIIKGKFKRFEEKISSGECSVID